MLRPVELASVPRSNGSNNRARSLGDIGATTL